MAGTFTAIDLSQLPAPNVVEPLDYETILQEMLSDFSSRDPNFDAPLESDPAYKILEVAAFRELGIRQRVNDGTRAVMLAYASGSDLDQLAANKNITRFVLDPGDPGAIPPVPPVYETDNDLRRRLQVADEALTTAGSRGSYIALTLSADPLVKDADAISVIEGGVTVYVLSRTGDGTADELLLTAVDTALSDEDKRPMTDTVNVLSASISNYTIEAVLTVYPGPDANTVRDNAIAAAQAYADTVHKLGFDVKISAVYAALHQPGVQSVALTQPVADISITTGEAAYCTSVAVTVEGEPGV